MATMGRNTTTNDDHYGRTGAAAPEAVTSSSSSSSSAPPPPPPPASILPEFTRVDGRGLWRSWKRNFKTKRLALLDLIDNSLDASLHFNNNNDNNKDGGVGSSGSDEEEEESDEEEDECEFVGRVHIYPDEVIVGRGASSSSGRGPDAVVGSRHFAGTDPANGINGINSNNGGINGGGASNRAPDLVASAPFSSPTIPTSSSSTSSSLAAAASAAQSSSSSSTMTRATGLCIVNNARGPVRPLVRVLEVYNSSKIHSGAGDIGENGVGLKQGCATLSDLSFVLAKNGREGFVELGIIAESLQMSEGCYLPAFRFSISDGDDDEVIGSLKDQMTALFSHPPHRNVAQCIEKYGSAVTGGDVLAVSDLERGIDRLCVHFDHILNFFDSDHVFAVVLDGIDYGRPGDRQKADPIADLRAAIPRTYLHVPEDFDFRVNASRTSRERIDFNHWPQRLVELSSFTVGVNQTVVWHSTDAGRGSSYRLRVFVGFDRIRINTPEEGKAASLFVYSRQSGRLIKVEPDARFALGLSTGGTTYCSGLTVLIDDIEGRLPLNPTKQDVAFGEEANGDVHKINLFAWVGAVTKFFYDYHLAKYQGKKIPLTRRIKEFGKEPVRSPLKGIDISHLTTFNAQFKYYGTRSIRIDLKTAVENTGADTLFHLVSEPPPPPRVAPVAPVSQPVVPPAPVAPVSQPVIPPAPVAPVSQPVVPPVPVAPVSQPAVPAARRPPARSPPSQPVVPPARRSPAPSPPGTNQHDTPAKRRRIDQVEGHTSLDLQPRPSPIGSNGGISAWAQSAREPAVVSHQHAGQHHGHGGASHQRTGQAIPFPSQIASALAAPAVPRHGAEREMEVVDLAASSDSDSDTPGEVTVPVVVSNAEGQNGSGEARGRGADVQDNKGGDDDESTASSTVSQYKDYCEQLVAKNEKRKLAEQELKKENRILRQQVLQLTNKVEILERQANARRQ